MPLRLTPEYRFEYDDGVDEMELVSGRDVLISSGRSLSCEASVTPSLSFYHSCLQVQMVIGEEDVARFRGELAAEGRLEEEVAEDKAGSRGEGEEEEEDEDEGFFGSEDIGEQEYVEISSADVFNRPGEGDQGGRLSCI